MVNMRKGDAPVKLNKAGTIRVKVTWPAATDYDLGAEVLLADGSSVSLANFGANGTEPRRSYNGVVLGKDVGRLPGAAMAEETLDITFDDSIRAVAPWAYSAQSNGTGSFFRYRVSMEVIDAQGQSVRIEAAAANDDDRVYTCTPALVRNHPDGAYVEYLEKYSPPGSENRPKIKKGMFSGVSLDMDGGPRNNRK